MVTDTLAAMRKAARRVQELLYDGTASVTEFQDVRDAETGITKKQEVTVLSDLPCRLSYQTVTAVSQTEGAALTAQTVKLFCSPEAEISPGSRITVTQVGRTETYECSGVPSVYPTHQEVPLSLNRRYA